MKRKTPRKRTPLRRTSRKQAAALLEYRRLKAKFLREHPLCEFSNCFDLSNSLHHMQGRGPNLNRVETFMACCHFHHEWIHRHPNQARELGYLK
jgi:hypothetical protein